MQFLSRFCPRFQPSRGRSPVRTMQPKPTQHLSQTGSRLSGFKHRTAYRRKRRWLRFSSGLDPSLRLGVEWRACRKLLDKQAISGDGWTANRQPICSITIMSRPLRHSQLYLSGLLYGRVDGRYARTPIRRSDDRRGRDFHPCVKHVQGQQLRRDPALRRLQEKSGGLMVSRSRSERQRQQAKRR